jgi:hypothetical protein
LASFWITLFSVEVVELMLYFCLTQGYCSGSALPLMASLIKKKKANPIYSYVVGSARVDGKSRIVHQTYLGAAEGVARLVQDASAPVHPRPPHVEFGFPGARWLAARTRAEPTPPEPGPQRDLRHAPDADGGGETGENLAPGDLFPVTE